jgi:hypothetical protein
MTSTYTSALINIRNANNFKMINVKNVLKFKGTEHENNSHTYKLKQKIEKVQTRNDSYRLN